MLVDAAGADMDDLAGGETVDFSAASKGALSTGSDPLTWRPTSPTDWQASKRGPPSPIRTGLAVGPVSTRSVRPVGLSI
ncbi:hypothetical protein C8024_00995 [Sphingopyxis sp. BSNA05]|nr:hypothetical protein [Sphingopyxis sp. BSNA05]